MPTEQATIDNALKDRRTKRFKRLFEIADDHIFFSVLSPIWRGGIDKEQ